MRRRGRGKGKGKGGKVSEGTLQGKLAFHIITSDDLWRYALEFLGPEKEEEDDDDESVAVVVRLVAVNVKKREGRDYGLGHFHPLLDCAMSTCHSASPEQLPPTATPLP